MRGAITGGMTTLGGLFHTLPFLISDVNKALIVAGVVVAVELFAIAWMRNRFLDVSMRSSLLVVTVGGGDRARDRRRLGSPEPADGRICPLDASTAGPKTRWYTGFFAVRADGRRSMRCAQSMP